MTRKELEEIRNRAVQTLTVDGDDWCANDVLKLLDYVKQLEGDAGYWRGVAVHT